MGSLFEDAVTCRYIVYDAALSMLEACGIFAIFVVWRVAYGDKNPLFRIASPSAIFYSFVNFASFVNYR